jgi:hypothetical protein
MGLAQLECTLHNIFRRLRFQLRLFYLSTVQVKFIVIRLHDLNK